MKKVVRLRGWRRFGATDFARRARWLAETKLASGERSLVEAAGVEPASEGTSPQDSTCVSALVISLPASKSDEKKLAASPGKSRPRLPEHPAGASPLNGASAPVEGALERRVAVN